MIRSGRVDTEAIWEIGSAEVFDAIMQLSGTTDSNCNTSFCEVPDKCSASRNVFELSFSKS